MAVMLIAGVAARLCAQGPHPHTPPPPVLLEHLLESHDQPRPAMKISGDVNVTVFDATSLGSPLILDKGWRVGLSDDPTAASPNFDDSSWAIRDAESNFPPIPNIENMVEKQQPAGQPRPQDGSQSHSRSRTSVWFRVHIKLAPNHGPLALLIELPVSQNATFSIGSDNGPGVEVYADGKRLQPEGPNATSPQHYQQISRIYELNPDPAETTLTLVLRTIYIPTGSDADAYTNFFSRRIIVLGNPHDLQRSLALWRDHGLFEHLPRLVDSIIVLILALFLFALYFAQEGHVEYLWLALYELVRSPIGFVDLAGSSAWLDQLWYAALLLQLVLVSAYLFFEFIAAFLALRRSWTIQLLRLTAPLLICVGPCLLLVGHNRAVGIVLIALLVWGLLWILGWFIFICVTLISAALRRNFEAGLLLIPLVFSLIGVIEPVLTEGLSGWTGHTYRSPLTIQAGPIPIHFASIADFTGIIVIILIIFVRFLRIQRDQERASSELEAARSVQELMIPHERVETPGYEVDSIYNPANEVGGDFFHLQSTPDGGLLVVIGDVAGKGMKAAMSVSMLMGALRRTPERSPARILESLNRVLSGSDSFTTCQAALFGANGEVILANAGHLPPYLNSQEIDVPGGLPLGVLPQIQYEEIRLYLHPGDRLLLLSDGVVEARRPTGELFGFDRMHNLSNQSAFYIADAAKAFGQQDDITVLTIRRLAQARAA
jgi:hypothetical protein